MSSALLKCQIGPVQEFIAQSRSTRDLWSGSYLLSWLLASGLNCLIQKAAEAGLDAPALKKCVIFPRLESQPLLQLWQPDLFPSHGPASQNDDLLTPNLTNLFLAELPLESGKVVALARDVEQAIRSEWKRIAGHCRDMGADLLATADAARFERQVAGLLHVAWQVTSRVDANEARGILKSLPLGWPLREAVADNSAGDLSFPATLALNAWQLDAVRQVRDFSGRRDANDHPGKHNEKDSLTGREERVVGGQEWWDRFVKGRRFSIRPKGGPIRPMDWATLFRDRQAGEYLGAVSFTKRVWHLAYLEQEHGLEAGHRREPRGKQFPFPSTFHVASHDPAKNEDDQGEAVSGDLSDQARYFAVLTVDGDEMGKWMSGEKYTEPATGDLLRDFSHRLSTFGLKCARPIVEACDGRLIYSGGDDVVALLPADTAVQCARFLRDAFKGKASFVAPLAELASRLLRAHEDKAAQQGKVVGRDYYVSESLEAAADNKLFGEGSREGELLLILNGATEVLPLPGSAADVSAGIAIAHFKSPLQDVVREAQAAERRAKRQLGRSAVAITLMKRSGEITEWGSKWESGGLKIYDRMMQAMIDGAVSGKFPHRVVALLDGYLTETSPLAATALEPFEDFPVVEIILREFRHALDRQAPDKNSQAYAGLRELIKPGPSDTALLQTYLNGVRTEAEARLKKAREDAGAWSRLAPDVRRRFEHGPTELPIQCLIGLCQTVAFAQRTAND